MFRIDGGTPLRSPEVEGPVTGAEAASMVRAGLVWVVGAVALVAVVGAPAVASWHGLVGFGRREVGLEHGWEFVVPVALDGAALYAAVLALRAVLVGDSAIWPRCLTWVYALASAGFNAHAAATPAAAVFYGGMSLSAVVLWDTTLRALRRDQLRELGAVAGVAARFRPLRWLLAPSETATAWRMAVVEDITDPRVALRMVRGEEPRRMAASVREVPGARVRAESERMAGTWSPQLVIGGSAFSEPGSPAADVTVSPEVAARERAAVAALATADTKADALVIAWRALGVGGDPDTGDVMPAVEWLAAHGVTVDRSRAYDVRRELIAHRQAIAVAPPLARGGGGR